MKFSFSKAASTLSLAALGVAAATSAQAAIASLNVEVAKVTAYKNATETSDGSVVLFDAANSIGGSENVTVDLLSTSDAAGKKIPVRKLTAAEAGVYRTVLIEVASFNSIDDDSSPNTVAVAGVLPTETSIATGNTLIVLGEADLTTGTAGIDDLATGVLTPSAPMKPIVTAGGAVTLPSLDIQITASSVQENSSNAATFAKAPIFAAVSPIVANITDDASVTDVRIEVDVTTTALDDIVVSGTDATLTVGLFPTSNILVDPIYVATTTYTGTVAATATTATQTVDLVDVAYGSYLPIAWNDTNSDGKLDAGETFAAADMNAFVNGVINFDATDNIIASTDVTDQFIQGGDSIPINEAAMVLPATQEISYVINIDKDVNQAGIGSAIELSVPNIGTAVVGALTTPGIVTVTVGGLNTGSDIVNTSATVIELPVEWEAVTDAGTDGNITAADNLLPGLTAAGQAAAAATSVFDYVPANDAITITVPFISTDGIDANGLFGPHTPVEVSASYEDGAATPVVSLTTNAGNYSASAHTTASGDADDSITLADGAIAITD